MAHFRNVAPDFAGFALGEVGEPSPSAAPSTRSPFCLSLARRRSLLRSRRASSFFSLQISQPSARARLETHTVAHSAYSPRHRPLVSFPGHFTLISILQVTELMDTHSTFADSKALRRLRY